MATDKKFKTRSCATCLLGERLIEAHDKRGYRVSCACGQAATWRPTLREAVARWRRQQDAVEHAASCSLWKRLARERGEPE